jgi:hypothetical protein
MGYSDHQINTSQAQPVNCRAVSVALTWVIHMSMEEDDSTERP